MMQFYSGTRELVIIEPEMSEVHQTSNLTWNRPYEKNSSHTFVPSKHSKHLRAY